MRVARRSLFAGLVALAGRIGLGRSLGAGAPDVLVIVADDLGIDRVGSYGDPKARTPTIDALAARGVRFTRCWACPRCSPTRGTILTGQYPFRTGLGNNVNERFEIDASLPMLPQLFDTSAALGKWHVSVDAKHPLTCGFDSHRGTVVNLGHNDVGDYFDWLKSVDGVESPCHVYATTDTANEALASTAELRLVNFNAPHPPFHVPPQELHSYEAPEGKAAQYRAMLEALDTEVARLLAKTSADTFVVFLGDNGSPAGIAEEGEDAERMKGTMYETGLRVPLIIAGPGVVKGATSDALVNTTDLFATLAEIAPRKVEPPEDSVSLWPSLRAPDAEGEREFLYTEWFKPLGAPLHKRYGERVRAVRDAGWKLIREQDGADELYDLARDPGERTDLLAAGELTPEASAAFGRLDAHMKSVSG